MSRVVSVVLLSLNTSLSPPQIVVLVLVMPLWPFPALNPGGIITGGVHHPAGRQLRERGEGHPRGPAGVQQPQEEHHVHPLPHRAGGEVACGRTSIASQLERAPKYIS